MKIENLKVYDLEESLIASGYPMRTELVDTHAGDKDIKRCLNLTKASNGNGAHGQWMTGVRVAFDLTCTNKMGVEAERYRFLEFVSSQSTMHRITKFDLGKQYCEYVDPRVIEIMQEKVADYNAHVAAIVPQDVESTTAHEAERQKKYLEILYTNPGIFKALCYVYNKTQVSDNQGFSYFIFLVLVSNFEFFYYLNFFNNGKWWWQCLASTDIIYSIFAENIIKLPNTYVMKSTSFLCFFQFSYINPF